MRFDHPWLLLLLAGLPWFWWIGATESGPRHARRTAWRIAVAACLILSASGVSVATLHPPMSVIAVIDRSASMPSRTQRQSLARVNTFGAAMSAGDRLGVVTFGANAAIELRPAEAVRLASLASTVAETDTNIAAAITLAQAALPRDGSRRIVLMSDGRETVGQADRAAAAAGEADIPVDIVLPDGPDRRQPPTVTHVTAPGEVRVGEAFVLGIEIEGPAGARGRLAVDRDGQAFESRDIALPTDGATGISLTDVHGTAGIHTYGARFHASGDAADDVPSDAGTGAVVSVSGEQSVLHVSQSGGTFAGVLPTSGFRVTHIAPDLLPANVSGLKAYDTVVLDDVPPDRMSPEQTAAIAAFVKDAGGGLLLLGSGRSLDAAGYGSGPLGELLPVDLRPRSGRRAPALGLVLVFDKSGSMADAAGGTPKIELARQAAMRVLEVLPPTDLLGLIAFDARPVTVTPLAAVGRADARDVGERLKRVEAGGSTQLAPAAELAVQWLRGAGAQVSRRQILLISDGQTSASDVERLRAAVSGGDVLVSAVAIGADANRALLRDVAESSGGRLYVASDARELPAIVAREAVRSAAGRVVEESFVLRSDPHPVMSGIDRKSLPRMGGYVVSAARPTAANILASHLDDPILSAWRIGLGRVCVFTADLGSTWSAGLRTWPGAPRLWSQAIRWLSRQADSPALRARFAEAPGANTLIVDAEDQDGGILALTDMQAVVKSPRGDARTVTLREKAPGTYEGIVPTPVAGPYIAVISGRDAATGEERRSVRGFYWSADRERQHRGVDVALLTRLAAATGGRMLSGSDNPFDGPRPAAYQPLALWLAGAALVLFLAGLLWGAGVGRAASRAWLQLTRPANLVTAAADVAAGYAVAGLAPSWSLVPLILSGVSLYAGGVVLNDYFDRDLDATERPERPIPSGRVQAPRVAAFGLGLLAIGVTAAFSASPLSGLLAAAIAVFVLLYDAWGKHVRVAGPLLMGGCRGLNLMLGVSAVPAACASWWFLAWLPVVYVGAITILSGGEVTGGTRGTVSVAIAMYSAVLAAFLALGASPAFSLPSALAFVAWLGYRIVPPVWRAWREPDAAHLRVAVRSGVLSLVLLNAALAAGFAGVLYGIVVAALLLPAAWLARTFAVT